MKPMREWTLGETLDFCHRDDSFCTRGEAECPFFRTVCQERVADWDLQKGMDPCSVNSETPKTNTAEKPRLAEVLGVEEDEEWTFPGRKETFRVHDGYLESKTVNLPWSKYSYWQICDIINHPESIIRAPRLTDAEIAIMRAVGAKWVSWDTEGNVRVDLWDVKPFKAFNEIYVAQGVDPIARVKVELFPSVKPGDCVEVPE